jgi:hypothetical protein
VSAGLEKKMFDIAEKDVDVVTAMITIPDTILVNFDLSRYALTVHSGSNENIVQAIWLAIWKFLSTSQFEIQRGEIYF